MMPWLWKISVVGLPQSYRIDPDFLSLSLSRIMCCGQQESLSKESINPSRTRRRPAADDAMAVEDLRGRLAETEARLARARAREAELNRRLEEMKRFVCVMEILESYLRRQFREQQERVARLFATVPRV